MMEATIAEEARSPWIACDGDARAVTAVRAELRREGSTASVRIVREVRFGGTVLVEANVWSRTSVLKAGFQLLEVIEGLGPDILPICEMAAVLPAHHVDCLLDRLCQSASKKDPLSASKRDPLRRAA